MSSSTSALRLPSRTFNRRSPWVPVAAAAIGAAIALSVSTLAANGPAPAPAARPAVQAPAAAAETFGTISSLRPLSDASFAISAEPSVPAISRAGVLFNYPGGSVRIGAKESVPARYVPGTVYVYPGGAVTVGATASGSGNENAQVVANCHQCR